ncbi:hypothetical protein J3D55_001669 [Chryseobacterium ginsenosidimutans]|uniref:hypothetical protein n=1 Tax=Chryseobacterium ginsenosidimutans TaxID=687846 RepID=UPI00216A2F4F|nr:hypothetical protein [Chryseobacterium ginsenosidimutans]MCS3868753.1 hypothetical protein [Chryseobacterium ginsenosidimutans]
MDFNFYKSKVEQALQNVPKKEFEDIGLTLSVEEVLESIALKIYKAEWSNDFQSPLNSKSRIFFSVWVHDKTIQERKLYYNIHALKLRELKGYKISSRNFAEKFRTQFVEHQKDWKNVSVNFGPLTLMEGWIDLNLDTIQNDISDLAHKFLKISSLIDDTLSDFKS